MYPAATIVGGPAPGYSSGEANALMQQLAGNVLPRGTAFEWTAMAYQEQAVGGQIYGCSGLACCWSICAWPDDAELDRAAGSGPRSAAGAEWTGLATLGGLGLANNLYTQIGLVLLVALSAKNAILIVEVARDRRRVEHLPIVDAAMEAARTRFRPIVMTSFAFILGVVPLVLSTGAGTALRMFTRVERADRDDRVHLSGSAVRAVVLRGVAGYRGAREGRSRRQRRNPRRGMIGQIGDGKTFALPL